MSGRNVEGFTPRIFHMIRQSLSESYLGDMKTESMLTQSQINSLTLTLKRFGNILKDLKVISELLEFVETSQQIVLALLLLENIAVSMWLYCGELRL